jgi:serine phosphatase RsbU (regulator of sigma subunit)
MALLAYLVALSVADIATPDRFMRLAPFLSLAPFAASAVLSLRQTVIVSVLSVAIVGVTYTPMMGGVLISGVSPTNRTMLLLHAAAAGVLSVILCRSRLDREDRLLEREARLRTTAEAAQRLLLRELPLFADDVTVDGFYIAASHEALIGGDIYEVLPTPFGTRAVIGDVRGKGLPAMGAGSAVLTAFREGAYQEPTLETVVERMEQGLMRYEKSVSNDGGELFVTALVLEIAGPDAIRIIDCGHVPPFIIADDDVVEVGIEEPGLPLGLKNLAAEPRRVQDLQMTSGSRLLACTDGVSEARDPAGNFYPLADRLRSWPNLSTARMLPLLRADLEGHSLTELTDDVAVLVVEREGWNTAAGAPNSSRNEMRAQPRSPTRPDDITTAAGR